jgi:hypothetical protein
VAYPQSTEDIEDELTLDAEDQMLEEDEDFGLDDLDSDFSAFLGDDEIEKTVVIPSDTEESELDLGDFDDSLDLESGSEPDDLLEGSEGELELDLDFDQDDGSGPAMVGDSIDGDGLPDLADLDDLEDEELTSDAAELEGIDFELASESDGPLDMEGDDELDLSDLGFEEEEESPALEGSSALQDEALVVDESDSLDLSDLETAIEGENASRQTTQFDLDELGKGLDTDEPEAEAAETGEAGLAVETADQLNMSDLDLEIEDAPAAGAKDLETETVAGGGNDAADELDLSDLSDIMDEAEAPAAEAQAEELNLDLGLESQASAGTEEPAAVADDSDDIDELDLSDLEEFVETEQEPAAEAQPEELDLDLGLESEASAGIEEPAAVADDSDDIDELNLSDLEEFIESEEAPAAQAAADDSTPGLDLDLDSQMEDGAPMSEISFDSQGDDELDFSDLEQMLESDEKPSVEATDSSIAEELDLQFDIDRPPAAEADTESMEAPGADAPEDDFLDIEQLLDEGEDSAPVAGADLDGDVTDLPLEMEAALVEASNGADAELEIDFDLESELQADEDEDIFDTSESTEERLESHLLASDEADFLEESGNEATALQDPSETSVIGDDEFSPDDLTENESAYGATHMLPGTESEITIADQEFEPYVPQKKARSKKPVAVLMVLILLALGVFTVPNMLGVKIPYISDIKIPYLSDLDIKIPYLSEWLNPEPKDVAGNLKIIPLGNTINGNFVDNSKSGQLFVIQGQIKNDYDHPRSYIKVTGKLFRKDKKVVKTATVYCGNMLSKSDLRAMDIQAISKKLSNRSGDRRANFKVKTGNRIPFMIVFDKLPRNLEEYTVEVESSSI